MVNEGPLFDETVDTIIGVEWGKDRHVRMAIR